MAKVNGHASNTSNTSNTTVNPPVLSEAQKYLNRLMDMEAQEKELAAKALELRQQREKLITEEKEHAASVVKADIETDIKRINDMVEKLNKKVTNLNFLGYHYREFSALALGDGGRPIKTRSNSTTVQTTPDSERSCTLCGTNGVALRGHDGKAHRFQTVKAAFTDAELSEKGYATRAQAALGQFPARVTASVPTTPSTPSTGTTDTASATQTASAQ